MDLSVWGGEAGQSLSSQSSLRRIKSAHGKGSVVQQYYVCVKKHEHT